MSKPTQAWTELAAALISRSEMFETSAHSNAPAIQQLMSSLGEVAASSFAKAETVPTDFVKFPAVARPAVPKAPAAKVFSTSKKEYQPALQDRTLAHALEQLQQMRRRGRNGNTTPAPKIVTSQFRK